MAKEIYIGVSGVARKIKQPYVGVSNVARKCKSGFIGVSGVARQFFQSGTPIGTLAVGTVVKLKESGVAQNYIIVHQGLPSSIYDSSCNGTWLLRKDLITTMARSYGGTSEYQPSIAHSWLNSTMLEKYDSEIQNIIKQVKIPYVVGAGQHASTATGANGLSCKVFLLSIIEVGIPLENPDIMANDGAKLSYFISGTTTSAKDLRRAYLDGASTDWWTRSTYYNNSTSWSWYVNTTGYHSGTSATKNKGIRPAIILPSTALVDESNNIIY